MWYFVEFLFKTLRHIHHEKLHISIGKMNNFIHFLNLFHKCYSIVCSKINKTYNLCLLSKIWFVLWFFMTIPFHNLQFNRNLSVLVILFRCEDICSCWVYLQFFFFSLSTLIVTLSSCGLS